MEHSTASSAVPISGDAIAPPRLRGLFGLLVGLGFAAFGLPYIAVGIFMAMAPANLPALLPWFFFFSGLFAFLSGSAIAKLGLWLFWNQPHWVVGTDRLQFITRNGEVLAEIVFENLAEIELYEPKALLPFIGFRLRRPQVFDKRVSGMLLAGQRSWRRFGFDWGIPKPMSAAPLSVTLETIRARYDAFLALAPHDTTR